MLEKKEPQIYQVCEKEIFNFFKERSIGYEKADKIENDDVSLIGIRRKSCHLKDLFGDICEKEKKLPIPKKANQIAMDRKRKQDVNIQIVVNETEKSLSNLSKKKNTNLLSVRPERSLNGSFISQARTPCMIFFFINQNIKIKRWDSIER